MTTYEYRVALTTWDGTQSASHHPDTDAIAFASLEEAEEVAAGYRSRAAKSLAWVADLAQHSPSALGTLEKLRAATYTVQRRTVGPWEEVTP